ncbi:CehA/McbA family metallohydrolase [Georgenia subflava]|uniref:PHP domain-containing protein n=1 Tax=Georgenia subflava TaxID=1622177 RepID=A0A6N7ELQ4_9MICO|nr:CehA/McbA family metallohydrolase [Georgenia subflava]MPV37777.1 PHP domain-containing protein [Georgenia subflava]
MTTTVHRRHLTLEVQSTDRYLELPFEVDGAESIEVTLTYDTGATVVDLGCQDPHRWRGWSGGARSRFVIGPTEATPGYLPGELPDGRWAVVLGLHRIPADGVDVTVTVTIPASAGVEPGPPDPAPPTGPRGSGRRLPAPAGLTWFAGDFHAHTVHSDGDQSIAELAARATARGLDFLAVTDHNTTSHHPHLPAVGAAYDLALLPGQEVTTHRGHANAFGDIGFVDFRRPAHTWVTEVADRGGLLSLNHPIETDCAWLHPLPELPPALELWHIGWFRDLRATGAWALWQLWRQDAVLLGGSDFHNASLGYPPGTPTTWVAAEDRSPEAILAAAAAGRTAITRFPGPGEPALLRLGADLVAFEADGTVLVDIEGRRRTVLGDRQTFAAGAGPGGAGQGPYRLEAADGTLLAISP